MYICIHYLNHKHFMGLSHIVATSESPAAEPLAIEHPEDSETKHFEL